MLHELQLTTNGQALNGKSIKIASGLVEEIECEFTLDSSWQGFDYLRALFTDKFGLSYEETLANNKCKVPHELLSRKGYVSVNLCAYNLSGTTKVLQMTSYMTKICEIEQDVATSGTNSALPTPAVWEQELTAHTSNSNIHTTAEEKSTWNSKLSDAPSDNKQYARKNGAWAEIQGGGGSTSWNDITNKPSTFPPSSHNHNDLYYGKTETDSAIASHHDSTKQDTIDSSHKLDYSLIANTPTIPSKTSELTNDSGFLTSHQDITGKEDKSNKVVSLSASSTDIEYPSAKCVFDIVGNVEALLEALL